MSTRSFLASILCRMPPKLPGHTKIAFVQANPKKAGSSAHDRYEKYKVAKTVDEAMTLGALRGDITNDVKVGYCTMLGELEGVTNLADQAKGSEEAAMVGQKRSAEHVQDAPSPASAKRYAMAGETGALPLDHQSSAAAATNPRMSEEAPAKPINVEPPAARSVPVTLQTVPTPNSASSSETKARHSDVDLSFATLDGKPMKFIKRTMGEAKRLLSQQGLEEAKTSGYHFSLLDRQNLSKWAVQLRDLNPDGNLAKDLVRHKLDSCIDLEFSLPDEFPLAPPFVRVVYPHLTGGFVFTHGGICYEGLTTKGWTPSCTLPLLAIAIKGIFDFGDVRVHGPGCRKTRTVNQFTEEGARRDANQISSAHRGGESNTYGSLKHYKS